MNTTRQTFTKAERLCSLKLISMLFEKGKSFNYSFLRVVWLESPVLLPYPVQAAFSVSKRSFRHAVTRNLIKRRFREAYRKNKHDLYEALTGSGKQLLVVIILRGSNVPGYTETEKAISGMLTRLVAESSKC